MFSLVFTILEILHLNISFIKKILFKNTFIIKFILMYDTKNEIPYLSIKYGTYKDILDLKISIHPFFYKLEYI